jgi:arylsulfatase A-like enzyme
MYYDDYPCERFLFGYGVRNEDIRPEDHEAIRALYAAEVSFVDMWVGRFLARLEELGYGENTVIAFTSDHGTHLGEAGYFQKTPALLNSDVAQLPLIIRHPDRTFAGAQIDALVSSVDFMPTFLDMLNIEDQPEMDGFNIWDLVTGEKEALRERVYSQFGKFAAVRDMDWHYFQPQDKEAPGKGAHLYNLTEDPEETTNVREDHPDVVKAMRAHLAERLGTALPDLDSSRI